MTIIVALLALPAVLTMIVALVHIADLCHRATDTVFTRVTGAVSQTVLTLMMLGLWVAGLVFVIWSVKQIWEAV